MPSPIAFSNGKAVGYLIGAPRSAEEWGENVWVELAGHAVENAEDIRDLWLSVGWQSCNLGGFWAAYLLAPVYEGLITVPGIHVHIFGYDENVFVFSVLTVILIAALLLLRTATGSKDFDATF